VYPFSAFEVNIFFTEHEDSAIIRSLEAHFRRIVIRLTADLALKTAHQVPVAVRLTCMHTTLERSTAFFPD